MSKILHKPATCTACGTVIEAGERADRSGFGSTATYRHRNTLCPSGVVRVPVAPVSVDRATERQVRYALLLQDSASPFERRTASQLAQMGCSEISQLIAILQSNG